MEYARGHEGWSVCTDARAASANISTLQLSTHRQICNHLQTRTPLRHWLVLSQDEGFLAQGKSWVGWRDKKYSRPYFVESKDSTRRKPRHRPRIEPLETSRLDGLVHAQGTSTNLSCVPVSPTPRIHRHNYTHVYLPTDMYTGMQGHTIIYECFCLHKCANTLAGNKNRSEYKSRYTHTH